jgi:predicted phosphohydrolase
MDIFGGAWENYVEKLKNGFAELDENDVCVICGDISWAMELEYAREDFKFISELPGKKIILKGNHDYWWSTAAKAKKMLGALGITSIDFLHNNFFPYGENAAVCGTRGWFYEAERGDGHDKKIMLREIARLETSLKLAGEREKYVFLHYPPKYGGYECAEILELFEKYGVKVCCAGHIHGGGLSRRFEGSHKGTRHYMVSADRVDFAPIKII